MGCDCPTTRYDYIDQAFYIMRIKFHFPRPAPTYQNNYVKLLLVHFRIRLVGSNNPDTGQITKLSAKLMASAE